MGRLRPRRRRLDRSALAQAHAAGGLLGPLRAWPARPLQGRGAPACDGGGRASAPPRLVRRGEPPTPRLVRRTRRPIGPGLGSRGRHSPGLMRTVRFRGNRAPDLCREHCTDSWRSSAGDADDGCGAADERCAAACRRGSPTLVLLTASRAAILPIIDWLTILCLRLR